MARHSSGERISGSISKIEKEESCLPDLLRDREGEREHSQIPTNPEGQRIPLEGDSQEAVTPCSSVVRPDCRPMVTNQGSATASLCNVQETECSHARSHHSAIEGGPAHNEEHSGSLPKLQQSQVQPLNRQNFGRNRRTVWKIATESFKQAHFATFPRKLVEPCLKAGTSAKGCCPACGAPWRRVVEKPKPPSNVFSRTTKPDDGHVNYILQRGERVGSGQALQNWYDANPTTTTGWQPTCECHQARPEPSHFPVPCTVLDPFAGAGTVGVVAKGMGLNFIGIELNPEYAEMARKRIANPEPVPVVEEVPSQLRLFA